LLRDAGYCPSPASRQGTSVALIGAYVLAGELAQASCDFQIAFDAYQKEMQTFIEMNQQLGVTVLKEMVSKSKWQLWLQTIMLPLLTKLPGKERILKAFLKELQQSVGRAANAIVLKNYKH